MNYLEKLISMFLAVLFILQLFPMKYFGDLYVEALAAEIIEIPEEYEFDIPMESDNTVDAIIPKTFILSENYLYEEENIGYKYDNNLSEDENYLFSLALNHSCFSELNEADKTFVSNHFSLGSNGFSYFELLEEKEFNLLYSIYVFDLLEKANYDFDSFIDLNLSPSTTFDILGEFYKYLDNVRVDILGSSTDNIIRNYLMLGYSVKEVVNAYAISSTLKIDMDSLLNANKKDETKTIVSTNNFSDIVEIANTYSVSETALVNYSKNKNIAKSDITSINNNIAAIVGTYSTTSDSDETDEIITTPYYYNSDENEIVSLNSGELLYKVTDYILPGKNGLDLIIGRIYSSSDSKFYELYPSYDGESETVYSDVNRHNDVLYSLGQGWSFAFSSIETIGYEKYLHFSTGEVYKLKNIGLSKSELVGYEYSDIEITRNMSDETCSCGSYYCVKYYNGKEEHFSSKGELTCIKDRYGNTISFDYEYATWNRMAKITITDTLQRETIITTQYVDDNYYTRIVTIALPDGNTLTYNVESSGDSLLPVIASYTNTIGQTTCYSYTLYKCYCFHLGTKIDEYSKYTSLTTITHPTNAQTIFEYSIVEQKLGVFHSFEYPRINKRFDLIGENIYNEVSYEYIVNNKLHVDSTTVTEPSGTKIKTTFNSKNKITSITTSFNDIVLEKVSYTYGNKFYEEPDTEIKSYYNSNGAYTESKVVYKKNDYNNPEKVWSTYAGGNIENTEHLTTFSYHEYGFLSTHEYKTGPNMSIKLENTYDESYKNISLSKIHANGTLIQIVEYVYDDYGNITKETKNNPNGTQYSVTEYTYQDGAYLTQEKHTSVTTSDGSLAVGTSGTADGIVTLNYTYNTSGRLASSTDGNGNRTSYLYDALGNITTIINPDRTRVTYTRDYINNFVIVKDEKGTEIKYTYTPLGLEYETIDVYSGKVLTHKEYDSSSRLIKVNEYIYGSVTEYTYDCLDRITSETVKQGDTILSQTLYSYEYAVENGTYNKVTKTIVGDTNAPSIVTTEYTDKHGNVVKTGKIIDGVEYFDTYTYDYVGNCTSVLTSTDAAKNLAYTSQYEYDHNGQVTKTYNANGQYTTNIYDAFGKLVSATDYAGTPTTYTYDTLGRLTSQTITIESGVTSTSKYEYDAAGNIIREWSQNNAVGSTADWAKTEYTYDNRNRLTEVKQYNGDTVALTTTYTYDNTGNVLTMTSGGKTTTYVYNRHGNITSETDALDQKESYTYYSDGFKLFGKTHRNGTREIYIYDALGRIKTFAVNDGTNSETQTYTYTKTGQIQSETNSNGSTTYTYDELGQVVEVEETVTGLENMLPDGIYLVRLDAAGGTVETDKFLVEENTVYSLPTPTKTGYAFNGWYYGETLINNGDTVALAENATFTASWTANIYTVTFHGYGIPEQSGGLDLQSNMQSMTYDVAEKLNPNLILRDGYTFQGWSTVDGGTVVYTNQESVINLTSEPNANIDLYSVWREVTVSPIDPVPGPDVEIMSPGDGSEETTETEESLETELTPDVEPETETEITSDEETGEVTGFSENYGLSLTSDMGEPIENDATMELEPVSEPVIEDENTEELESTPETETETESNSGIGLELVESGTLELTEVAETTSTPDLSALEDVVYCKTYTYDLSGNRTGFTLEKDDEVVHNIVYTYDNLNRLSTVKKNGTVEATYTYDANGNRASLTYANGVVTTYSYNLANWVTNLSNKNSDGETLSSYAYTYYTSGNQKSKTDNTGKVTSYIYDDLGRLKQESESTGLVVKYTYNSSGNRSRMQVTGIESYNVVYVYNAANQLTKEAKTVDGVSTVTNYTYDANGNTLTVTSPDSIQVNTYDAFNRLVATNVNGNKTSYIYNTAGIRTAKSVDGIITAFLLDGGNVVGEIQSGEVTANYLRGANLILRETDTAEQYYIFNAHGDVTGLVNNSQTVTKSYNYDAFGNEKNPSSTDTNPFRYCGEYFDKETGTYYLRARYYDPSIGRFTQQDTHWNTANMIYGDNPNKINERQDALGLKTYTYAPSINSIMQSGNLYVYCVNNPIAFIDETGCALRWPGEIHNAVQKHIAGKYGYAMEIKIIYSEPINGRKYGRADLVDVTNGLVWEIKPNNPVEIAKGVDQINAYTKNTWIEKGKIPITHYDKRLSVGGKIPSYNFTHTARDGTIYNVSYKYHGNGIIVYDYFPQKETAKNPVLVGDRSTVRNPAPSFSKSFVTNAVVSVAVVTSALVASKIISKYYSTPYFVTY